VHEFQVLVIGPFGESESGGIATVTRELISAQNAHAKISAASTTRLNKPTLISFLRCIHEVVLFRFEYSRGIKLVQFNLASRGSCLRKTLLSLIAPLLGLRFVFVIHGGGFLDFLLRQKPLYKRFVLWRLKQSNGVASVSSSLARGLMAQFPKYLPHVWPLANGLGQVENTTRSSALASEESVKIFFIGADSAAKGFPLFLDLADKYGGLDSKFRFVAAGGTTLGRQGNVHQLGVLNSKELQLELESAGLLVVPSKVEAMPMVILEAMKSGVPVMASKVGDIPEVLDQGALGTLFDGDFESLERAFNYFSENGEVLRRVADQAYLKWEHEYTGDAMFNRHLKFWQKSAYK